MINTCFIVKHVDKKTYKNSCKKYFEVSWNLVKSYEIYRYKGDGRWHSLTEEMHLWNWEIIN